MLFVVVSLLSADCISDSMEFKDWSIVCSLVFIVVKVEFLVALSVLMVDSVLSIDTDSICILDNALSMSVALVSTLVRVVFREVREFSMFVVSSVGKFVLIVFKVVLIVVSNVCRGERSTVEEGVSEFMFINMLSIEEVSPSIVFRLASMVISSVNRSCSFVVTPSTDVFTAFILAVRFDTVVFKSVNFCLISFVFSFLVNHICWLSIMFSTSDKSLKSTAEELESNGFTFNFAEEDMLL